MEKKSGKIRKKKRNFTQVTNCVLRDPNISLGAKGLYGLIESYLTLENFTVYQSELMKMCKEGERAFTKAWKELKETGYLIQYKYKDERGYYCYEYELLDTPETSTKTPPPQNEGVDNEGMDFEGVVFAPLQNEVLQAEEGSFRKPSNSSDFNNSVLKNTEEEYIVNNTIDLDEIGEESNSLHSYFSSFIMNQNPFDISIEKMRFMIHSQINYNELLQDDQTKMFKPEIDQIVCLMEDVYYETSQTMVIGSKTCLTSKVKSNLLSIDKRIMESILDAIIGNKKVVSNPKAYLLTLLYNAPMSMGRLGDIMKAELF